MKNYLLLIFIILLPQLFFSYAFANDLNSLKQYALENNPEIIQSRESIACSLGGEVNLRKFPKLRTNWYGGYSDKDGELIDDSQMFQKGLSAEKWNSGVFFDIELFEGGRGYNKRKTQKAIVDACEARLQTITIQVFQELELAYFNLCHLKKEKSYILESIELLENTKQRLRERTYWEETSELLDIEIQKYHTAVGTIENDTASLRSRLYQILGLSESNELTVENLNIDFETDGSEVDTDVAPYEYLAIAFNSRSELKEIEAKNRLSELKSLGKVLAFLPSIGLVAQYNGTSNLGYYPSSTAGDNRGSYLHNAFFNPSGSAASFPRYIGGNRGSSDTFTDAWKAGISMKWSFATKKDEMGEGMKATSSKEFEERMNLAKDMIRQQLSSVLLRLRTVTLELDLLKNKLDAISTNPDKHSLDPELVISIRSLRIEKLQKEKDLTIAKVVLKYTIGS